MKLHWSPRSPFVRKVEIALHEADLVDKVTRVRSVVALIAAPNPDVLVDNPLGQIPTLVPQTGPPLYDSRVICEYIDGLSEKTNLFPTNADDRFWHLHWQALGDGLATILITLRNERLREGGGSHVMRAALETKARASIAALTGDSTQLKASEFGIGHIAIACALGQLEFRFRDSNWRAAHTGLAAWFDELETRPSIATTKVVDDGTAPVASGPSDLEKLEFST
ncbi:glutathione S-transferase N-terminal domain-containing protein [Sulfitobacter sp. F26204]|uniref:glutathione S-transferase family protein n=1 Tax=Sulfitobacter sp. F26204 TaxID=2996014 RepID=UPI00225E2752|nr:glutathione S-transferase N-terminal domain-containing protein [Sulfitobacter sp. F26204]MCX7561352.1 glutathione S-transferase N-terminal domain-containing protein [Sulfitobacter sp. F26204]